MKTGIGSRRAIGVLVVVAITTSFESGGFALVGAHAHISGDGFENMSRAGTARSVFNVDRRGVTAHDHLYVVGDGEENVSNERVLKPDDGGDNNAGSDTSSSYNENGEETGVSGEESDEGEGMSTTTMIGVIIGAIVAGLVVLAIVIAILRKVCCLSSRKSGEGVVVTATAAEPPNPSSVGRPANASAGTGKAEIPMAYAEAVVVAKPVLRSVPAHDNNV